MYTEFVEKSKIIREKSIKKGHSNSENTELECPSFAIKITHNIPFVTKMSNSIVYDLSILHKPQFHKNVFLYRFRLLCSRLTYFHVSQHVNRLTRKTTQSIYFTTLLITLYQSYMIMST